MSSESNNKSAVVTPEFRLAFPAIFEPAINKLNTAAKPRYEVTMLIPKDSDVTELKRIAAEAVEAKWPDAAKRPKGLRNPLRDGDEKDYDGYTDHWFAKATSLIKPKVVGPDGAEITPLEADKVYAGCYCRAYVNAYAYDQAGNRGVSFGLLAVQLLRDGEPFVGAVDTDKVFGKVAAGAVGAGVGDKGASIFD